MFSTQVFVSLTLIMTLVSACGGGGGSKASPAASASSSAKLSVNLTGAKAVGVSKASLNLAGESASELIALDAEGKALAQKVLTVDDADFKLESGKILNDGSILVKAYIDRTETIEGERVPQQVKFALPNGKMSSDCFNAFRIAKDSSIDCLSSTVDRTGIAQADSTMSDSDILSGLAGNFNMAGSKVAVDGEGNIYSTLARTTYKISAKGAVSVKFAEADFSATREIRDVTAAGDLIYLANSTENVLAKTDGQEVTVAGDYSSAIGSVMVMKNGLYNVATGTAIDTFSASRNSDLVNGTLAGEVSGTKVRMVTALSQLMVVDTAAGTVEISDLGDISKPESKAAAFLDNEIYYANSDGQVVHVTQALTLTSSTAVETPVAALEGVSVSSMKRVGNKIFFSGRQGSKAVSGSIAGESASVSDAAAELEISSL